MSQPSLYGALLSRKVALGATLGGAVAFMFIGVAIWGGFNWAMEETNTQEFCISCHEMEVNVYAEYKGTIHDGNRSGVRASCPDCHVPRPWVHKIKRKIQASNELWHKLVGTVDTPEKFDAHRLTMAKRVWKAMKETDSRECRNCHDLDSMNPAKQKPRARQQHMNAMEKGNTCIDCHKGVAHTAVHKEMDEDELAVLNEPDPELAREVPEAYKMALAQVEAEEAEEQAKQQEEMRKEREAKKAAKQAEKKRIEEAVAAALAAAEAQWAAQAAPTTAAAPGDTTAPAATTTPPTATAGEQGFGIDWSAAPERLVTIFYPGQTSMEWTLVGKYHGGARPFKDGDRCTTCHDKETALMGPRMSTGQKAEPTPLPDKRASIPVVVQAVHDQENIYFRFQWDDTEHVPVPFVDGGKMDPENQVKLAVMLGTDEVIYAGQSGCWGTCHHDLRSMPEHPDDPTRSGLPLDFSAGVTKYIKESRTKVEEKGRRGKKLGGWDKLKEPADIESELAAGHFMDLWRWNSDGTVENGHVLEQRIMASGQGLEAQGWNDGGTWTVVMKRKLTSDQPGDVSIEPGKLYNVGFAIHDDFTNARFHHVSLGYKLGLDNPEAEVNAVGR